MKFRTSPTTRMPERKDVTADIERRKREQAEADRQTAERQNPPVHTANSVAAQR